MAENQKATMARAPAPQIFGVLIGPLTFGADLVISYALVQHACSTGHHYVLHLVTVICFVVTLSGAWLSWRQYQGVSNANDEGGSPFDRAHFFALVGIASSLWFAVVIIANALPRFILSPCD
jgi:hypothetical protein